VNPPPTHLSLLFSVAHPFALHANSRFFFSCHAGPSEVTAALFRAFLVCVGEVKQQPSSLSSRTHSYAHIYKHKRTAAATTVMELSNRQWRALAQAYPYFFPPARAPGCVPGEEEAVDGEKAAQGNSTKRADFEQYVVPRMCKAFQSEVAAWKEAHTHDSSTPSIVDAVEALTSNFFGRPAVFMANSVLPPPFSTSSASVAAPLTAREVQLLGLYHRKQEQYEYVYGIHQQLLETSHGVVRTLQLALHAATTGAAEGSCDGGPLDSTRESLMWLGGVAAVAAAAFRPPTSAADLSSSTPPNTFSAASAATTTTSTSFTSALANLPYTEPSPADERGGNGLRLPASAMVINRCAGCVEADGDLIQCTQCGEVRHEACGGPHPPERSCVDGQLPTVNICRKCAKELNLSSSSSSLRSSTSSSERAELEEYFDSEDDTESSLSGFVVHSSDEEEVEDKASAREWSSGSRSASEDAEENGTGNHQAASDGRRTGHATQASKAATCERRRDGHRRRGRDDDSSSSNAAAGRGHTHQKEKRQRTGNDTSRRRTDSWSSDDDDAPASSPSKSSPSTHNPHRVRGSLTATKVPAQPSSKQRTDKSDVAVLSSQEKRRRLQDEEEELAVLGIPANASVRKKAVNTSAKNRSQATASSGDASPSLSQQAVGAVGKKRKGGRRSVVNVASSSSSNSSDDSG
jgi:hypothetical protein